MLEKLSGALKKTTDKIANAVLLDKKLVDSVIKELQRALIEADVNVSLVKELSEKVKKAAFDERIKGVEKKEHIVKLLHDELVRILGVKREIVLGKKNRFLFVGLYGAGKCVHGESGIQLSNGEIVQARDLYKKYSDKLEEERIDDGKIIDMSGEDLYVFSFNPLKAKVENKRVTYLWKLSKDELMEIKLDNGNDYSVRVTPEHPFFVLRNGQIVKVRADEITEEDHVAVPNCFNIKGSPQNIFDKLKKKDLFIYFNPEEIDRKGLLGEMTLREVCSGLKNRHNYCKITQLVKRGQIPIELVEEKDCSFRIRKSGATKVISIPSFVTPELAEFLGYVVGDGHIEKNYVEISSENIEIIERINYLSKSLFDIKPRIKRDLRTRKMCQVQLSSTTLVDVLDIFCLTPGKKGRGLKIPEQIFLSENDVVRSFIRAYFDCDSSPSLHRRNIDVISESKYLIRGINHLLRRFGVLSSISKKEVKKNYYWRLSINASYAEAYADKIGYLINEKLTRVERYRQIGEIQGDGKQDMVPLGKALKALRLMLGFSIGEIQRDAVYSYGIYENKGFISKSKLRKLVAYYKSRGRGVFLELLRSVKHNDKLDGLHSTAFLNGILPYLKSEDFLGVAEGKVQITERGSKYLNFMKESEAIAHILLQTFESLSESDVCWLSFRDIENIKNNKGVVYDLTVEDNHSFVADGIIVHNTTSIGKIGAYYAKRGYKVCTVGLDVHRPAAMEQLKQVSDKVGVSCFISPGERDALKVWKNHEKEIKKFDLVLIDSAGRDALDVELIREIEGVAKLVKATEKILVMPADIGQSAQKQAKAFKDAVGVTGVFITRMDSTAKGGGALTACAEVDAPVVFIGTGEKPSDIETFDPESFLSRLLGMGDLSQLIEKVHSVMDEKEIEKQQQKLMEGKFTLKDFAGQLDSVGELGSFDKLMGMIPGFGKVKEKVGEEQLEQQESKVKRWKHIINSMTPEEQERPELLEKQTSRIQRVARGAGVTTTEVRSLLKQFKMMQEMIANQGALAEGKIDNKMLMKMARKFGKRMKF